MTQSEFTTELASGVGRPECSPGTTVTLFIDFDGVLHPEYGPSSRFFESLPLLALVLQDRPWVELVVSSNWRYERVAERYERTATIVTSNLDFTEWDQAFPANPLLASATLDRLRHNAYCLVLDGQSYRTSRQMPSSMPTKSKHSTQQKDFK